MSPALRHYLLTEHVIGSAIVNFLLNALIAWLSFRHVEAVPLWGTQSIGGDLVGTTIVLPLLTCLIVTRIVRWHLRAGKIDQAELSRDWPGFLRALPDSILARGLVLAALTTMIAVPLILATLYAGNIESLELRSFVLFKATYAAVLAMMVQPLVALRAMMDGAIPARQPSPVSG